MMISPTTYYEEVKDTGIDNLQKEIRRLKRSIARLKKELEKPNRGPDLRCPSRSIVIYFSREYLKMAKKALAEAGGEYHEIMDEKRATRFMENLPYLQRLELDIITFMALEKYVIEIEGDTIHRISDLEPKIEAVQITTREELLNRLQDIHLDEWKKYYNPNQYGMFILDGIQWTLKLEYSHDIRLVQFVGDNVFPWNFEELCTLFGIDQACSMRCRILRTSFLSAATSSICRIGNSWNQNSDGL